MKKYVKPELFYEHYELSQHIADCAWEMNLKDAATCKAQGEIDKVGTAEFMFTDLGRCDVLESDFEDYCYQNSTTGVTTFIS